MDDARALMNQLMGEQRNQVAGFDSGGAHVQQSCYDPATCPYYSVWGVDVYELFANTRSNMGSNPRACSKSAREHWLSLPPMEQTQGHYGERDLLGFLTNLIEGNDRVIRRNVNSLRDEQRKINSQMGDPVLTPVNPQLAVACSELANE
ncbi:hypothetical protein TeGR_g14886 [Tetraparma gracilis]|jgi:hypothetical protein|uniref:Uncharacterized protein n=1 Tax=Tetraparma gracilis TaxID=2962635 RepID=A0ABQ6N8K0_9STRA|nr:hypothetical protein TeGR_g14886 [Tetraparma gracilis]